MSTMILGHDHVNGILSNIREAYRKTDSRIFKVPSSIEKNIWGYKLADVHVVQNDQLTAIGRLLIAANCAAFSENYSGRYDSDLDGHEAKGYSFKVDPNAGHQDVAWLHKQIQCLRYNSDIADDSELAEWLQWCIDCKLESMDSYKAAPWGYDA